MIDITRIPYIMDYCAFFVISAPKFLTFYYLNWIHSFSSYVPAHFLWVFILEEIHFCCPNSNLTSFHCLIFTLAFLRNIIFTPHPANYSLYFTKIQQNLKVLNEARDRSSTITNRMAQSEEWLGKRQYDRWSVFRFLARVRNVPVLLSAHNGSGAHHLSYTIGSGVHCPGLKLPGSESDCSTRSSAEIEY